MKLYVASSIHQAERVARTIDFLRKAGFGVECDWASKYLAEGRNAASAGFNDEMVEAIRRCDALVLMLPGGRGAHFEFGGAHVSGKKCFVLYDQEEDLISFARCMGVVLTKSGMELINLLDDYRRELEQNNG